MLRPIPKPPNRNPKCKRCEWERKTERNAIDNMRRAIKKLKLLRESRVDNPTGVKFTPEDFRSYMEDD